MKFFQNSEIVLLFIILAINIFLLISLIAPRGISGFFIFEPKSQAPSDFIKENKILADNKRVVLEIENPILIKYTDSDSMLPLLGKDANGIAIKPASEQEINVGDVISFKREGKVIAHRVIEKGIDDQGTYFITKGDNNNLDDGKIRFLEIDSVLVAVIY